MSMTPCVPNLLLIAVLFVSAAAQLKICMPPEQSEACSFLHTASKDFHCIPVDSSSDCFFKLNSGAVDFGKFRAEEAVLASELQKNVASHLSVIGDVRNSDRDKESYEFQTVVVVRSSLQGGLAGLKGRGYCHPGFSKNQYWTDPVLKALERAVLKTQRQCTENSTKLETELSNLNSFFGPSCRPGLWSSNSYVDKKLKQKYPKLCELCGNGGACSYKTNSGSHSDVLSCLKMQAGDVAYTSLDAALKFFEKPSNFQYLCQDGTTEPSTTKSPCTWVKQPWPILIAAPGVAHTVYGKVKDTLNQNSIVGDRLKNVLGGFSDVVSLSPMAALPTLGEFIAQARDVPKVEQFNCPRNITWCTTSDLEQSKCNFISTAARTHGIAPYILCPPPVANTTQCLKKINNSTADVTVITTNDGFIARDLYNLTAAAYIEGDPFGYYYHGVIVVNASSNIKTFGDLKYKRACFPSFNGLGWLNFIRTGIELKQFSKGTCASSCDAATFFKTACAPGAKNSAINPKSESSGDNLCAACTAGGNCKHSSDNPFFGEKGALDCLISGAGDVAFVDYNVFASYPDTNDKLKNLRILCKNGNIRNTTSVTDIEDCASIQVISHEIVASRKNRILFREIQIVMEQINDWFSGRHGVLNLFGRFKNQTSVLFPKEGIDLINTYVAQGPYTNDYKELLSQLKYCSDSSRILSAVWGLLLGILVLLA